MSFTYRQLGAAIQNLPVDRMDDNVAVEIDGEFFTVKKLELAGDDNDVLDAGHLVLLLD